jgi:predicted DsbA family dithiol-disulfide isomerase
MRVEIWSDIVCPWGGIGSRMFDIIETRARQLTSPIESLAERCVVQGVTQ